jgi:hypothetical protein
MKIKFNPEKHPELEIDVLIKPKLFGLNIQASVDSKIITPSNKKKHKYDILKNGISYDTQITSTPYESKIIINGEKFNLTPKTEWYNYLIGGLPFALMINGGIFGGVFGFLGWSANMNYLRFGEGAKKYFYVLGITTVTALTFIIIAGVIGILVR